MVPISWLDVERRGVAATRKRDRVGILQYARYGSASKAGQHASEHEGDERHEGHDMTSVVRAPVLQFPHPETAIPTLRIARALLSA